MKLLYLTCALMLIFQLPAAAQSTTNTSSDESAITEVEKINRGIRERAAAEKKQQEQLQQAAEQEQRERTKAEREYPARRKAAQAQIEALPESPDKQQKLDKFNCTYPPPSILPPEPRDVAECVRAAAQLRAEEAANEAAKEAQELREASIRRTEQLRAEEAANEAANEAQELREASIRRTEQLRAETAANEAQKLREASIRRTEQLRAEAAANEAQKLTEASIRHTEQLRAEAAAMAHVGSIEEATAAYRRGDYVTASRLFQPIANAGNGDAQTLLGVMYYDGKGVAQDYSKAIKWYRKAANQGHAEAQFFLGVMYYGGKGVRQDYVEAHKWYNLAASRHSATEGAQRDIALKFRDTVASKMTPAQIAEAQKRARKWKPK
jgi:chemotaxis protein histidine kinase CheA